MLSVVQPSVNSVDVPQHPWPTGYIFQSPGGQFSYRVIGPCCRLYDREQLPWPCCRLQWHSKEPSWRRIGRRLVVDMATRRYASYAVELLNYGQPGAVFVMTLYTMKLTSEQKDWWLPRVRPSA
ncbi:MAG: hypothetical protein ACFCU8_02080 [Thermosynechococcaceae cyanobacterium]